MYSWIWKSSSCSCSRGYSNSSVFNQSRPPRFQEKAELLLQFLPGTLLVTIKWGINLKQSVGNPSAVTAKLHLGMVHQGKLRLCQLVQLQNGTEFLLGLLTAHRKVKSFTYLARTRVALGRAHLGRSPFRLTVLSSWERLLASTLSYQTRIRRANHEV